MQKWRIAENNFHIGNFAFCTINQFSLLFGSHSWAFERVKKLVWLYRERSFGSGNRVLIYRMFFVFSSSLLAFQPKSPNTMAKITCSFAFRLFSSIQLFSLLFSSLPFPFCVHFPFDSLHSAICSSVLSTYHRCGAFKPDYDANKNCVNVIADALLPPLPNVILAHKRRSTTHAPCPFACWFSFILFMSLHSFQCYSMCKKLILTFCVRKFFGISLLFCATRNFMQKCSNKSSFYGFSVLVSYERILVQFLNEKWPRQQRYQHIFFTAP